MNNSKYKKFTKTCVVCKSVFKTPYEVQKCCSLSCANTYSGMNYNNRPKCIICGKEIIHNGSRKRKVCSKTCQFEFQRRNQIEIECLVCHKKFKVPKGVAKNRKVCNRKCMGKLRAKRPINRKPQFKSYGETALFLLLKKNFPNLEIQHNNTEILDGLEIDIWIPELKSGIEFNGPHHFKPVYGEDRFKKTQESDLRKLELSKIKNIKLLIIESLKGKERSNIGLELIFKKLCSDLNLPEPTVLFVSKDEIKLEQGKKSPKGHHFNLGRKMTEEARKKMSEKRGYIYTIESIDGERIEIIGLSNFCESRGFYSSGMSAAFKKSKSYNGWKLISKRKKI